MKKLMIVESPGKLQTLQSILGSGWEVAACYGHVRDLPLKEIGVEAPDFKPQYELTERGAGTISKLRQKLKQADEVYIATDPDREGEAIGWHVAQCLKFKSPKRITFDRVTAEGLRDAFRDERTINIPLVAAQEARRVLDRLVGYMVSPRLSDMAQERLSAGRVQSVALRLVVDREAEIQAFSSVSHFGAHLIFADAKTGDSWTAEWVTAEGYTDSDSPYVLDSALAEAISNIQTVEVMDCSETEASRNPPPPFNTSAMQQAASVTLDLDPEKTMAIAQRLFDLGHITYHRTDNPNLAAESLPEVRKVAEGLGLTMASEHRKFKVSEAAQAGHPAVTPAHWEVEDAGETEEQKALYRMIRLRAIASQLEAAKYAVRVVRLQGTLNGKPVIFEAKGRVLTRPGWLQLVSSDQTSEEPQEATNAVPHVEAGSALTPVSGEVLAKRTKAPPRYTAASLIAKLEAEGVGRPATYHTIMSNIKDRGYVRTEKKLLLPTDTGKLVVDTLRGRFEFMEVGFTRDVEGDLDRIAQGQDTYRGVIGRFHEGLSAQLRSLDAVEIAPRFPCPACGKGMRRIKGSHGFFWSCSGYPDCKETRPDDNGKPGAPKKGPEPSTEFHCEQCGKPLIHRHKKGRGGFDFWGCSGFKDGCRATYENKRGKPVFKNPK